MRERGDGSGSARRSASRDGRAGSVAPGELFTVYLTMALLAAFSQVALVAYWTFGPGFLTRLGPRVIWMTPLAVAIVYAVPAIALLLLSRVWPRAGSLPVVFGLFSVLATIDLALMERRLALWAIILLALGIGVQVGRTAEAHRAAFMRFARAALAGLILLVLLGTAAVEIGLPWRERSAESRLPAARAGAPNVLLIILDTVRGLNLSLHGYSRNTTPVLDSLSATATVFDRAIVTGTWSVPSHGSIFTGQWPHALAAWWSPPRRAPFPTLAEVFSQRGYRTGAVVANWWSLGRESGLAQGFLHYDDLGVSFGQILRGSATVRWLAGRRGFRRVLGLYDSIGRRGAPEISRNFLRWAEGNTDRPYFAFLNYLDAHSPYLPPPPFDQRFGYDVSAREPIVMEELNRVDDPGPEAAEIETAAYDGAIAYLDHEVGRMLRKLDARGGLANTIVVITSDHGEELGEHGAWGHGRSLHAQTVHVPLMFFGPGIPRGIRVAPPTSLRHIAATIADVAGLANAPFAGRSLALHWSGAADPPPDTVITELGTQRSVYFGKYHFIGRGNSEGPHLYEVIRDPRELNDLIAQPVADSVTAPMMALIAAFADRSGGSADRATGRR